MNEYEWLLIVIISLGFSLIFGPVYLYRLHFLLLKKLKAVETREWNRLGSPTLIMNNTPRHGRLIVKWLLRKEYLQLDNPEIAKEARLCRMLLTAAMASTIIVFIGTIMSWALPVAATVGAIAVVLIGVIVTLFWPCQDG